MEKKSEAVIEQLINENFAWQSQAADRWLKLLREEMEKEMIERIRDYLDFLFEAPMNECLEALLDTQMERLLEKVYGAKAYHNALNAYEINPQKENQNA